MEFEDLSEKIAKLAGDYQYREPPDALVKLQEVITNFLRAVADFFKQFRIEIPGISNTSAVGDALQITLVALGALALAALVYLAWTRMSHLNNQAKLARKGAQSLKVQLDSAGWKEQAIQFAQREKFREAVRAAHLSLLYALDEAGIIEYTPTRSNFEYYYALDSQKRLNRGFRSLTERVEEIWFGDRPAYKEDYENCMRQLETLASEIEELEPQRAEDLA